MTWAIKGFGTDMLQNKQTRVRTCSGNNGLTPSAVDNLVSVHVLARECLIATLELSASQRHNHFSICA